MKILFIFSCLFCSPALLATVYYHTDPDWYIPPEWQLTPTLSYEANSLGTITNFGLKWGGSRRPGSNIELVGNFSYFTDERRRNNEVAFTNFDTSIRFGVFDRFNLYGEIGIALDELFTDGTDERYYNDYDDDYVNQSRPDWFAGVGAGWQWHWLTLNVYARYRYLESLEEQYLRSYSTRFDPVPDRYQWFSGVELSVRF